MDRTKPSKRKSALSDITPNPGPGMLLTVEEHDSLDRCEQVLKALFAGHSSRFSRFEWDAIQQYVRRDALADIVRQYWYDYKVDRRTKGSDFKRELTKVVTHLAHLQEAIQAVSAETKNALNRVMQPPTREHPERRDIFGEAERLNNLILEHSRPLVLVKYVKLPAIRLPKAGDALSKVWVSISQQEFDRNTKVCPADSRQRLFSDNFEFESEGMYFVHVMLQAIDPAITYSNVRTGMRRAAASSPKTR